MDALIPIKVESRKKYLRPFNQLQEYVGEQLETRPPTDNEMLSFIGHLGEEKNMEASTLQYDNLSF